MGIGLVVEPRYKSKAERDYAVMLEVRRRADDIRWWAYEPVKFKLADGSYYTPDFLVFRKDLRFEFVEVKGHWREAARVRWKSAHTQYPFFVWRLVRRQGKGFRTAELWPEDFEEA